jgi:hypothetical protein
VSGVTSSSSRSRTGTCSTTIRHGWTPRSERRPSASRSSRIPDGGRGCATTPRAS